MSLLVLIYQKGFIKTYFKRKRFRLWLKENKNNTRGKLFLYIVPLKRLFYLAYMLVISMLMPYTSILAGTRIDLEKMIQIILFR